MDYTQTIGYIKTNPITGVSPNNYYYYYFNTPGKYGFSIPIQNIQLYYVIGGGGGYGGVASSFGETDTCPVPQNGGGGGGGGGEVKSGSFVSVDSMFIKINVGGVGEPSTISYSNTTIQASKGNDAPNTSSQGGSSFFCGDADNKGGSEQQTTGGVGANDINGNGVGGVGGITFYKIKDNGEYSSDYKNSTTGSNGSGSGGGGGGAACWKTNQPGKDGGDPGPGTSVTFYDGTGEGKFCKGGKGGTGCYQGTNGDYGTISATKGEDGSPGVVLIYFYSEEGWNPFSYFPLAQGEGINKKYIIDISGNIQVDGYTLVVPPVEEFGIVIIPGFSIPLFPDMVIYVKSSFPIKLQVPASDISLGVGAPLKQLFTNYIQYCDCNIEVDVQLNGIGTIPFVFPLQAITTYAPIENSIYGIIFPFPSYKYSIDIELISFTAYCSLRLQLDSTPDTSAYWFNVILDIRLEITEGITGYNDDFEWEINVYTHAVREIEI